MLRATDAEAVAVSEAKQKNDALTDKEAALADAKDQLFLALPYGVTLVALIFRGKQSRGPAALAQPYRRS